MYNYPINASVGKKPHKINKWEQIGINMKKPKIFRKRFIPFETVDISGDELLFRSTELLITKWKAIKPRSDFYGGISYTFLNDGFKIAKFYDANNRFLYWYCDIIEVEYDSNKDAYTLVDLLIDIKLMPDGLIKVLDADELAEAMERNLVTCKQACFALNKLDQVLKMIYNGDFPPEICRSREFRY